MASTTAKNAVAALKDIYVRFGILKEVVSNQGLPFNSSEFATFNKEWYILHNLSTLLAVQQTCVQTVANGIKGSRHQTFFAWTVLKRTHDRCISEVGFSMFMQALWEAHFGKEGFKVFCRRKGRALTHPVLLFAVRWIMCGCHLHQQQWDGRGTISFTGEENMLNGRSTREWHE